MPVLHKELTQQVINSAKTVHAEQVRKMAGLRPVRD
jgi:hypothetical protein